MVSSYLSRGAQSLLLVVFLFSFSACIRSAAGGRRTGSSWFVNDGGFSEILPASAVRSQALREPETPATIRPVDPKKNDGRFRADLPWRQLWGAAADVLGRDYQLLAIDATSGVILTDWKKFDYEGSSYRSKVTYRQKSISRKSSLFSISILVERKSASAEGNPWTKTRDPLAEEVRLLLNLALVADQPAPTLPMALEGERARQLLSR